MFRSRNMGARPDPLSAHLPLVSFCGTANMPRSNTAEQGMDPFGAESEVEEVRKKIRGQYFDPAV